MIEHKLGKTRDWIFPQMEHIIFFGIKEGFEVTDVQIEHFLIDMRKRMAGTRGVDANMLFRNFLTCNAKKEGL
jgi:hypothetical protein